MALTKTQQTALTRANNRLSAWVDTRLDDQALDIARLYKGSRDTLVARLRHIYDTFLQDEPSLLKAQTTQASAEIQTAIAETVNELSTKVGQASIDKLADLGGKTATAVNRFLKPYLGVGVEALPVSSAWVFQELTTSLIGGGTYVDRLFNIGENLKADLFKTIRQGLISGTEFDDLRGGIMKSFGVDQLAEPKFNAYGSVKIFQNEARRQWNLLMSDQAEKLGGVEVWISRLLPTTTPGCAARHGHAINELGEQPPRHYNCYCTIGVFSGEVNLEELQKAGTAWLSKHGYSRKAAMLEEAAAFDPTEHPRDEEGKFAGTSGGRDVSAARVPRQMRTWVDELGAKVNGIQDAPDFMTGHPGYLLFTDRVTGTTMMLDLRDVTKERIAEKIATKRAEFAKTKKAVESYGPWWGPHRLVPIGRTMPVDAPQDEGGMRYQAIPWRALPLLLRHGLSAPLAAPSLLEAHRRADLDAVVVRFPTQPTKALPRQLHVLTADEGWVSVQIKGAVYIENPSGLFAADSPVIQRWEPPATTVAAGTRARFPGLRALALRNNGGRWEAVVLSREEALPWAFGGTSSRTEPRPRGVVAGRYFPGVVDKALTDSNVVTTPHLCVWDDKGLRVVCQVETGVVLYAREQFSNPDAYQRVAVYCPEGLGVWAIRPRNHPYFVLPGGHIEKNETRLQAAQREMIEETGVPVTPMRYLGAMHRPWATTHVFLGQRSGPTGTPTTMDEIAQRALVPLDELDPSERTWLRARIPQHVSEATNVG